MRTRGGEWGGECEERQGWKEGGRGRGGEERGRGRRGDGTVDLWPHKPLRGSLGPL